MCLLLLKSASGLGDCYKWKQLLSESAMGLFGAPDPGRGKAGTWTLASALGTLPASLHYGWPSTPAGSAPTVGSPNCKY